jgi:hypothetical protein
LAGLYNILMLIPFRSALWLVACHLILLITLGCSNGFLWLVRHS